MINRTVFLTTLCLFIACACGNDTASERAEATASDSTEEVESGYRRPIDKARKVEDQLQDAAEKQKRDIEEQEGGG